jgi:hypothetical protein
VEANAALNPALLDNDSTILLLQKKRKQNRREGENAATLVPW